MTSRRCRSPVSALVLAWLILLSAQTAAMAASSLSPSTVEAGSEASLSLDVSAPPPGNANRQIELTAPDGFTVLGCSSPNGWSCTSTSTSITWTRSAAPPLDLLGESFPLRVRAPADEGEFRFAVMERRTDGSAEASSPRVVVTAPAPPEPQPSESASPEPEGSEPPDGDETELEPEPSPDASPSPEEERRAGGDAAGGSSGGFRYQTLAELVANGDGFIVAAPGREEREGVTSRPDPEVAGPEAAREAGRAAPGLTIVVAGLVVLALTSAALGWVVAGRRDS